MLGVRTVIPILALIIAFILRRKRYQFSWVQMIITLVASVMAGLLASKLSSTGVRQYGPVIVDTILWLPLALLIKKDVLDVYDYCSVVASVAMWTGKIPCLIDGCCKGIMITDTIRYPSQVVEFVVLFIILVILIVFEIKHKYKHRLWPIFMVMFGVHRFLANLLRGSEAETKAIWLGLAEAEIASLAIAIFGVIWLAIANKRVKEEN